MNILLLEDDPVLAAELKSFLKKRGYDCDAVYDGDLFLRSLKNKNYSVYLLDINVPKKNGLDICKIIRESDPLTPIIMVTAYGEIEEKTDAFNFGADDYLVKPFNFEELLLRIKAALRKKDFSNSNNQKICIDDLEIYTELKEVYRAGEKIELTPKEFKLLILLAEANGRVVSKQQIADRLWDYHIETTQNTIEVYINFLRNKIDKKHDKKLIHTKVGFGYFIKA